VNDAIEMAVEQITEALDEPNATLTLACPAKPDTQTADAVPASGRSS